jgi:hypothetical protein
MLVREHVSPGDRFAFLQLYRHALIEAARRSFCLLPETPASSFTIEYLRRADACGNVTLRPVGGREVQS